MTNAELKELVREKIGDEDVLDRVVILEGDEFADGAIGVTDDGHVVYGYERLVESLSKAYVADGEDPEEAETMAIEWLDYNTLGSIPYMGSQGLLAPIIIYSFE